MSYNFKNIKVIPPASQFINIILSKTQRKTPTVVHPGYAISRIRSFYMRKIKFCEETIMEKLNNILENFPKIEDIHPFYGDLFNVLYDKDHYKLALGHVKSTKNLINNMSKDYLKLVKYGDSLYRCKCLKRAALGRMCTMIKKIGSSLSYLEEVRKHMGRLPSINPYERTLLLTGYPNVGKSSFINAVTKANVEVQPYPYTTKALYVGHTDFGTTRFQVIDSPGVEDHLPEDMNTIEMQSVTALAHLKSCILYFVDLSEQCGFNVYEQMALYQTLKPLFKNKPILIVLSKCDIAKMGDILPEKREKVQRWLEENGLESVEVSAMENVGIDACRNKACQEVLKLKMPTESKLLKNENQYLNGLYISEPKKRDDISRPPVEVDLSQKVERPNIKKLEEENGGPGVFDIPLQEHYILPEEWKYDLVPEIWNGKNVADFVDSDIWQRLGEIEKEQDLLMKVEDLKIEEEEPLVSDKFQEAYKEVKRKKHAFREEHAMKKGRTAYSKNKPLDEVKEILEEKGLQTSLLEERVRNRSRSKSLAAIKAKKRSGDMSEEEEPEGAVRERIREASRSRSKGYRRVMSQAEKKGKRVINKLSKKWRTMDKKGQADRFIGTAKPKHLYSGKSSSGSRDWR